MNEALAEIDTLFEVDDNLMFRESRIGPGAWAFNGQRATSARTNSTPGHVEGQSPTKLNHILISLGPLLSKI
ncbi:hypothetical protein FOVSG1_000327 [Fusarium oxysporum f. sp. vasinfectum]